MAKETATQTAAIVAYCSASIFMTLINKFTLSAFTLHPVFLILAIQAFTTVALMWIGDALGLIEFRRLNRADAKAWLPINLGMVVMLYTGGKSLQFLSVPLFTIVKNLTIILVAYLEAQFSPATTPPPSRLILLSFFLMVFSSVIGSYSDLEVSYHLEGYVWMALNCLSSAWFVLLMRKIAKNVDFRDMDTVYYNNIGTWWMFLGLSWALEDWNGLYEFYIEDSNQSELSQFVQSMVISGCSAFAIGYASAWCLRVTNSTTYSMTGALNKLPVAVAGMIFFGGDITVGGVASVLLGFSAGLMYTYGKSRQKKMDSETLLPQTVMKSSHIRET